MNRNLDKFFENLNPAIHEQSLNKLVISNPRHKGVDIKSLNISLVDLKRGLRVKVVFRYPTKDVTMNMTPDEAISLIKKSLETDFFNADLFTTRETMQLTILNNGKVRLSVRPETDIAGPVLLHDRKKARILETSGNIYLRELGILNDRFEVRREMNDKFVQINRYIELLDPILREMDLPDNVDVTDMGAGKGYLTFALYDYLLNTLEKSPAVKGVESRRELVDLSNQIAAKAGFHGLTFMKGMIRDVSLNHTDILIALHACDTATDEAIFRGIQANASLIVCAPCCHKQIRKEFRVTGEMKSITKYGILGERQAEIITDAIRALMLEAYGYSTRVFEFVSTEHTPKNIMITGRKIPGRKFDPSKIKKIQEVKAIFGISHHWLETLLLPV